MIKVKDGYAKLIGTTYQGSATQVLLSNGGDLEYSASSKASTLVQRNASQHIYATYFNSAISDEALTDIGSVYVRNTSDTFIRRVSKTQFYSILDDKFVTLDTTQSITGAKTFSTSVRFANNASIIQNQNDTSNYTTILKWYKMVHLGIPTTLLQDSIILEEMEMVLSVYFRILRKLVLGVEWWVCL